MNFKEIGPAIERNSTLNPKLWDHDRLKSEVRGALLRIADDFKKYVEIPFEVVDIVITGSNVNYNYTSKSDIDLHLIADFDSVNCDREAAELFDTKRLLYEREHDISIYGIPVGLYVEDQRSPGVSAGTYSIMHEQWVNKPNNNVPEWDQDKVDHMVEVWNIIIKHAIQTGKLDACRNALKLLRTYRKLGLKQPAGEFSVPNLVYKSLRNSDSIHALTVIVNKLHDQALSLG